MILEVLKQPEFDLSKTIHYVLSIAFLVNAIWLFIRSGNGLIHNKPYLKFDKILSFGFIINLYLQLIFGVILFSNMGQGVGYDYITDSTMKMVSKRLWPVEHVVLMLFALFIANLGLILSIKSDTDKNKHRNVLIYYLISLLLISISLGAIYFF